MGFSIDRIKANGKAHYDQNKWNNVIVIIVWLALVYVGSAVASGLAGILVLLSLPISLAATVFGINILNMGMLTWFHKAIDSKPEVTEVFEPFSRNFIDNAITLFLRSLFVGLWSLLLVVPGIIKSYEYYLVEYIKAECPNMPPKQVLDVSKRMMDGHKMDMFVLNLSFIGWALLSALTLNILGVFNISKGHTILIFLQTD